MKKTILVMFAFAVMTFAACNSDRNGGNDSDSLMTDTATMDNGMGATDTSVTDTMSMPDTSATDTAVTP